MRTAWNFHSRIVYTISADETEHNEVMHTSAR
jgi:hypothetical protein